MTEGKDEQRRVEICGYQIARLLIDSESLRVFLREYEVFWSGFRAGPELGQTLGLPSDTRNPAT